MNVYVGIFTNRNAGYGGYSKINPIAAERLTNEMIESANKLTEFPYINPVYHSIRSLKKEYRRLIVKNYIMFYYVDESRKLITVARVIYAHRNYNALLD